MPKYQLLVSDMDSTVAAGETIVDMADALGIGPKIAEITERSMRGELDFRQALEERVMMLRGLELSTIQHIAKEVGLSDGAQTWPAGAGPHGGTDTCQRWCSPARTTGGCRIRVTSVIRVISTSQQCNPTDVACILERSSCSHSFWG